jgi:glycine/D-amino acid oxidase-like deaminating enzyme
MNNKESQVFDYTIIGAGIAGLAIAELFSRSGYKVALVEKNSQVCQETSGSHHGWFHFGSLYSIFPSNQHMRTMVGGIDDVLAYYSDFPNMNIKIGEDGKLFFPNTEGRWVRDEPIEYIMTARNNPDFNLRKWEGLRNYGEKIFFLGTWEIAIKQFISRHKRYYKFDWRSGQASEWIPKAGWFDYSREVITKPTDNEINLDPDTHFRIVGFDRPMEATNIISDLMRSFLHTGGKLFLNHEVEKMDKKDNIVHVVTNDGPIESKDVIVCAGKWLQKLLGDKVKPNVVASPLLVVYPALCSSNFVRMTPFVNKSINHLLHFINGKQYSLIGGGYFADPHNPEAVQKIVDDLAERSKQVFPKIKDAQVYESYLSYKTEIPANLGERNYQYIIRKLDDNIHLVIPGKFTLAFSLALNTFKKITGSEPKTKVDMPSNSDVSSYVGVLQHGKIVEESLLKNKINKTTEKV